MIALGEGVDTSWLQKTVIINPAFDWGENPEAQADNFTILGLPRAGTHASHVCVPVEQLCIQPAHLSAEQAAALPLAGLTAYRALMHHGGCNKNSTVLISGVGGGVALFALQYAVACGARVIATSSSAEKRAQAEKLGAVATYNYRDDTWHKQLCADHGGVDIVIDGAVGPRLNEHIACCNPGGRIIIYGGTAGLPENVNIRPLFWKQLRIQGSTMGSPADFTAMINFIDSHSITPVIDSVFSLDTINDAYQHMADSNQFGKIVLRCQE